MGVPLEERGADAVGDGGRGLVQGTGVGVGGHGVDRWMVFVTRFRSAFWFVISFV